MTILLIRLHPPSDQTIPPGTNGKKHERTNDRETVRRKRDGLGAGRGEAEGPAAGASVEPAVLRRHRHAHRARRHMVLSWHAHRAARPGQAVLVDPQARGRPLLPCHPGRKGRHHGRRRALRGRGFRGRGRRARRRRCTFITQVEDRVVAGPGPPDPRGARPADGRTLALCPDPPQPRGADRPQILLPAGRAWLPCDAQDGKAGSASGRRACSSR